MNSKTVILAAVILLKSVSPSIIQPYFIEEFQPPSFIDYIYFKDKIAWSSARAVCQGLGGDLAKIDSQKLMDAISTLAAETYQRDIFKEEYWIGLVELTEGGHFWVSDCSNLTYTSKYADAFSDKYCFRHKHNHDAERKGCMDANGFMCEVPSHDGCKFSDLFVSEVISVDGNISSCRSQCSTDPKCWAAVEYVPDSCVMLSLQGYGVQNFTVLSKYCFNVTENTTIISNPDITNNFNVPNATCGNFTLPTPENVTIVTSIGVPPCDPINVTQTQTLTTTENVTLTITNTSYITRTENVTLTHTATTTFNFTIMESTTLTSVSTTMGTTTSTVNVYSNFTYTVTTTVMSTFVQNISNEEALQVAAEIAKNLSIDTKATSSHHRRLTSAEDGRKSASFVGYVGVLFVVVPMGILFLSDIKKLIQDFLSHEHLYRDSRKKK